MVIVVSTIIECLSSAALSCHYLASSLNTCNVSYIALFPLANGKYHLQ